MGQRVFDKADFYVRRGNRKRLRHLIGKHRYLMHSDEALLVFSAIWHNTAMLPWLLDRGVHPDSRLGEHGNTPLMQATADGDVSTMRQLLDHGADPNARNEDNETHLGFACAWNQWQAAELLIDHGAEVNAIEDDGKTYLDWVTIGEHAEGIELLRAHGARTFADLVHPNGT